MFVKTNSPKLMKKNLIQLLLLLFPLLGFSQGNVKFIITDASNKSTIPGATVVVKGTTNGASSDVNGIATLKANPTDIAVISILGYESQNVAIENRTEITVVMQLSTKELSEVVVVGSRRLGRVKSETTAPVDLINVSQLSLPTGRMDLTALLNYSAPSLNSNKQSGSDGADHEGLRRGAHRVPGGDHGQPEPAARHDHRHLRGGQLHGG